MDPAQNSNPDNLSPETQSLVDFKTSQQPSSDINVNTRDIQDNSEGIQNPPDTNTTNFKTQENEKQETQIPQPKYVFNPNQENQSPQEKPKQKRKILSFALIFILILIPVFLGLASYAIAYEKIKLDKYPGFQTKVANFIIGLPFMRKTPKYLINRAFLSHMSTKKHSFNISIALDSKSFSSALGTNKFVIETKGAFDYSDPQNIKIISEISLDKDLNIEIRKNDPVLYFKINKFPPYLLEFIGIDPEKIQPLLENWVALDTKPLTNQSGRNGQGQEMFQNPIKNYLDLDEEFLDRIKIQEVKEENTSFYKLTLEADSNLIEKISEKIERETKDITTQSNQEKIKPSEIFKDTRAEVLIDKKTYLVHKIALTSDIEFGQGLYSGTLFTVSPTLYKESNTRASLVLLFDDFGKEINVETPKESISFQEFSNNLTEIAQEASASFQKTTLSNDARRKSDLLIISSGLELFRMDCQRYPSKLEYLVDTTKVNNCPKVADRYLNNLPTDPTGSAYFYQVSEDFASYDLCAELEVPDARYATCPDKAYNYHVKNPR